MNEKGKRQDTKELFESILELKNVEECELFFDDLCTVSELNALSQRINVAKLLRENMVYSDIAKQTGASSATISRVARCLNYGNGGYAIALDRTDNKTKKEDILP